MKNLFYSFILVLFCLAILSTITCDNGINGTEENNGTDSIKSFTNIEELRVYLVSYNANTQANPIKIKLTVNMSNGLSELSTALSSAHRYVDLDLSDCSGITNFSLVGQSCRTWITALMLPNSVTTIADNAFSGCTALTSVNIPIGVKTIGWQPFSSLSNLTMINVATDNTSFSSEDGVLYNKEKSILIKYPEGKTGSLNLPDSITDIDSGAFTGASNVFAINAGTDNTIYSSIDGILLSKDQKTIIRCPEGKIGAINIPNSVADIGYASFWRCRLITSVIIPNSVQNIRANAFYGCILNSVTFQGSIPASNFASSAFDTGAGRNLRDVYLSGWTTIYGVVISGSGSGTYIRTSSPHVSGNVPVWIKQ